MTSFEICGYYGSVILLSSGVPDIKFCKFIMKVDIFDFKVYGGDLGFLFGQKVSLGKPPEEGCFADITIADKDELVLLLFPIR